MTNFNETVNLHQTSCSAEDVERLMMKIEPTIHNEPRSLILMTVLSIAFLIQDESLSTKDLVDGVRSTSQHIALFLSGIHSGLNDLEANKAN